MRECAVPEEDEAGRRWIVEPPEPGAISLHIAVGEDTELTEEQEAAIGALLGSLEARDPEVMAHAPCVPQCPDVSFCNLSCQKVRCGWLNCVLTKRGVAGQSSEPWNIVGAMSPRLQ
jgi:hypothetical protein